MTGSMYQEVYCGVVKIDTVRTDLFIGQIDDLQVAAAYIWNAYLHGFYKDNIFTVAGPEFFEW